MAENRDVIVLLTLMAVQGDLSDHRPLVVNADDFLRCANVPELKAVNYRDFAGVISHRDGELLLQWPCMCLWSVQ